MHKYKLHGKKGEGTFSEVLKAQDIKTGKLVAIKCMKNHFDSVEQVNRLREIQALRRLSPHPNIIKLHEVLYDRSTGRLALVFELMEMNIYEMIRHRKQYLPEDKILHLMYQLVKGIDHMHKNGIFHRDIKPENILVLNDALKLADFGSCRGIYSKQPFTEYISTRWYRAPECLLTDGYYNYKMDVWGVGCVFFEIMSLYPLFPGTNELDQIHKIHNILGTPPVELLNRLKKHGTHMDFDFPQKPGTGIVKLLPHASPDALDLMQKLLIYNPDERISAKQALRHNYFKEIRELDKRLRKASKMQQQSVGGSGAASTISGSSGGGNQMATMSASGSRPALSPSISEVSQLSKPQHSGSVPVTEGSSSSLNSSINAGGFDSQTKTIGNSNNHETAISSNDVQQQQQVSTPRGNHNGGKLPSLGGTSYQQQHQSSGSHASSNSSSGVSGSSGPASLPSLTGAPLLGGGAGVGSIHSQLGTHNPYSSSNKHNTTNSSLMSSMTSTKQTTNHFSSNHNNTGLHGLNSTLTKKPQALALLGGGDLPKLN